MYQDECDRRLRGVKDGGRRDSTSYRDRSETDRASYANGSGYGSPNSAFGAQAGQYTYAQGTYGAAAYGTSGYTAQEYAAGTYGASSTTSTGRSSQSSSQQFSGIGRSGQQPQPLMSQQFAQPPGATNMIGYMGQTAYQYPPPPPPPPPSRKWSCLVGVQITSKGTLSILLPYNHFYFFFSQPLWFIFFFLKKKSRFIKIHCQVSSAHPKDPVCNDSFLYGNIYIYIYLTRKHFLHLI